MTTRILPICLALAAATPIAQAATDKYRLIWNDSPATSVTVAWCQLDGEDAQVHYGDTVRREHTHGVDRQTTHLKLESRFARLRDLRPDTVYHFVIRDSNSESPAFSFKTAPVGEARFSFVAGGDSRNHHKARQRANRMVAALNPLFVCFGGDMISRSNSKDWSAWLDDWQLTTGADGRMVPIIAARGNHEGAKDIHLLFDSPIPEDYYAVGFGDFLRVYTLNSNIVRAGDQGAWLAADLKKHAATHWKIAHYHHPFRPHHAAKAEQHAQYNAWAPLFYTHGLDLAIECDSHVVKRTWPLRPSNAPGSDQGFIRDDAKGTTFIGEGCWGAPLRRNNDDKAWTRASGSFNQVDWICVSPEELTVRTILVDDSQATKPIDRDSPFTLPTGMKIWQPESGAIVTLTPRNADGRSSLDAKTLARVEIIAPKSPFDTSTEVRISIKGEPGAGAKLRYTLDGSEPTAESPRYRKPISLSATTTIRAAIFRHGKALSATVSATATRADSE